MMSRNPFQGGMGFFTRDGSSVELDTSDAVAIPFRVGWGFSQNGDRWALIAAPVSQSLSGWDGGFSLERATQ